MQKNSSSAASAKTTAANLEALFDAGRDVLDYFDSARVVLTHGGLRVGAGRTALELADSEGLLAEADALRAASGRPAHDRPAA